MPNGKVKVGIIGSQFEADIHAASFQMMPEEAEVVAVASPTPGHAEQLAKKYGIPRVFLDYREMLKEPDIELVTITAPNYLHAQMTVDIANAGKHVVCEKPLSMTLEEADEMIDTCRRRGVLLAYAEELFFTPKYVKAKEMADQGGFGKVYLIKQSEKHFGPHSPWFWNVDLSGGGALMDLGCHGIAFCYWFLGRPAIKTVYAQLGTYVHAAKTKGDDDAICILEFENGAVGLVEDSWGRRGGMSDRTEVYGEGGVTYADLHMGNALPTYSEYGFGYAVEKAPTTTGWSYPFLKNIGTTEFRRRCGILPGACAARRRYKLLARMAGRDAGAIRGVCVGGARAKSSRCRIDPPNGSQSTNGWNGSRNETRCSRKHFGAAGRLARCCGASVRTGS